MPRVLTPVNESSSSAGSNEIEGFTESVCVSCNTDFTPPTSSFMIMHWVRALIHMYCISFQQLERELIVMHSQYGSTQQEGKQHTSKMCIAATLLHMMHAWCMLARCIDSQVWRSIAQSTRGGVPPRLHLWYRDMPHVSDMEFVRKKLDGTCTPSSYPRIARNEPNSILVDGLSQGDRDPYFIPMDILSWVVDTIHQLPVASGCIITLQPPSPTGASAVQTMLKHATFSISHSTLTCLTMPRKFLTSEQYWFLIMCIQSLPPSSPSMPSYSIRVKKVCAGTVYHMYSPGGGGDYDNLGQGGAVVGLMAWSAAAHMARAAKDCLRGGSKKTGVYLSLPGADGSPKSVRCSQPVSTRAAEEDLNEGGALWELPVRSRDAILSWKRRSKVNSIGHIVVGWVSKSLAPRPITSRGWD